MEGVDFSHNLPLVTASFCLALIAGFTGLSLTRGLSQRTIAQRKMSVVLAAIALGGGIWSMHFVAMLGLQLPIVFYYDATLTLISALVVILIVGMALLILHFGPRTRSRLIIAGTLVGLGVIAMHYIGMAGLERCRAVYTPVGLTLAVLSSCALNVLAFGIAYGDRSDRNILLGAGVFGLAVFSTHFIAIAGTDFVPIDLIVKVGPSIGKETLAIGVVLTTFVLCGAFLLIGATFLTTGPQPVAPDMPVRDAAVAARATGASGRDAAADASAPSPSPTPPAQPHLQIPYTRDGRTMFVDWVDVAAIRAEGHYTQIYTREGRFFSAWSITEAEKRLARSDFVRAHRSYLINPAHVSGFERLKDTGVCYFSYPELAKVPVSRSRLKPVRDILGV